MIRLAFSLAKAWFPESSDLTSVDLLVTAVRFDDGFDVW
jgi:hypothetical protein